MAKKKAASAPRKRTIKSPAAAPSPETGGPTYDQIAEAAYRRYLQRGRQHGGDFGDWIEAERELRSRK